MKKILEYKLIELGDYTLRVFNVAYVIIFIAFIVILLFIIKKAIYRTGSMDVAKKFSFYKLSRYLIVFFSIAFTLNLLGFNISVLLAGSAALLVGLGFGLQNLFNDFISGIILLLDSALKVGDIIEVNGMLCQVQDINFRTTTVLGRDENYVILPNSELTKSKIINWTHNKISSRFHISIGVDYASDVPLTMDLLQRVPCLHPLVLKEPTPFVRFEDYGDSALMFSVYFFTDEIFRVENIKSEIRTNIFKSLKENGVEIPFPQRVIHTR